MQISNPKGVKNRGTQVRIRESRPAKQESRASVPEKIKFRERIGMKLYTFWRSQAAFRVRIALNLKGLKRDDVAINLDRGDQFKPEYIAHNPQAVVPTLYDGSAKLFQSVAILEYLDEKYPNPPILPKDLLARAWVRGFALINAADSHPLIVPRIRNYLADVLKVEEAGRTARIQHWLGAGLHAMEELLAEKKPTGKFCHGDSPTVADICLVTQVTPAQLCNTKLEPFKRVTRIYEACMATPAFADAHPRRQPDFAGH
jgi:maleylacetoacetate isomerase